MNLMVARWEGEWGVGGRVGPVFYLLHGISVCWGWHRYEYAYDVHSLDPSVTTWVSRIPVRANLLV